MKVVAIFILFVGLVKPRATDCILTVLVLLGTSILASVDFTLREVVGLLSEVVVQEDLEILMGANMVQGMFSHPKSLNYKVTII